MILDAHHHFWRYSREEYGWISAEMEVLARDYCVSDLREAAGACGVTGSIVVQARQTVEETDWLLDLADGDDFIRGVVGWAPLAAADVGETLDRWSGRPKLRGLRHVVQDEPDDGFLLGDDFNRGVGAALQRGLTYDLLIFARHLPTATEFVDRHPSGRFVLDHLAKPAIAAGQIEPWRTHLQELAKRPNIACKVSGVVTEADWSSWTADSIRPYLDAALDAFGPRRLMYGSDWPVCLLAAEYARWVEVVADWAGQLSPDEQASFFYGAAGAAYQLQPRQGCQ
jgi:L-fuconolactonase